MVESPVPSCLPEGVQQFVNDMAEAVPHLNCTDLQRELIKAGLRACIRSAVTAHVLRQPKPPLTIPKGLDA